MSYLSASPGLCVEVKLRMQSLEPDYPDSNPGSGQLYNFGQVMPPLCACFLISKMGDNLSNRAVVRTEFTRTLKSIKSLINAGPHLYSFAQHFPPVCLMSLRTGQPHNVYCSRSISEETRVWGRLGLGAAQSSRAYASRSTRVQSH